MRICTWGEIETKIRTDMDLLDQNNFISQDEMATMGNDAIDAAEALIMRCCEDYFLVVAPLITLVVGQANYPLPTDIYAQKIREIVYKNNDRIYPVIRLKDPLMFYRKAILDRQAVALEEYRWFLRSTNTGAQDEIILSPPATEGGAFLELWYIRHAARILLQAAPDSATRAAQLACPIDIPEWRAFLEAHIKLGVYEKLKDREGYDKQAAKLAVVSDGMVVSLKDRSQDNENDVPQDISHYVESN